MTLDMPDWWRTYVFTPGTWPQAFARMYFEWGGRRPAADHNLALYCIVCEALGWGEP